MDVSMKEANRILSYVEAEKEAIELMIQDKDDLVLMGQGINDDIAMFGVTTGLYKKYGAEKIFDTPLAETGLTGVATGLAMNRFKVLYMHNRPDFLFLTLDQLINHATKFSYMSGGQVKIPLVIWAVVGQGWGSAAQHSQNIHGILMQVPGLKIIMPTTPSDAKGLLISALNDGNPVLFLEHRRLLNQTENIEEGLYKIPIGKAAIRKSGKDVTIIGISAMILDAYEAAERLEQEGVSVEIIDLRTIKPFDKELVLESVRKCKRVVIADTSWITGSVAKEISDFIYGECFGVLKSKIEIVALPDVPTPSSYVLEEIYYRNAEHIYKAVKSVMGDGNE